MKGSTAWFLKDKCILFPLLSLGKIVNTKSSLQVGTEGSITKQQWLIQIQQTQNTSECQKKERVRLKTIHPEEEKLVERVKGCIHSKRFLM